MKEINEINTTYILWLMEHDSVYTDASNFISACEKIKNDPSQKLPELYNKVAIYAMNNNFDIKQDSNKTKKYFLVSYGFTKFELGVIYGGRRIGYYAKKVETEEPCIKLYDVINNNKEENNNNQVKRLVKVNK